MDFSYRTLEKMDTILCCFEYNKANTITEAINQYVYDAKMLSVIATPQEGQRKQPEAMQAHLRSVNSRLNSLQSSVTADLSRIAGDKRTACDHWLTV